MSIIFFNVNGKDIQESNVDPELTLGYYLRNTLNLRGTKLGCEEGVCGSCTVVLSTWDHSKNRPIFNAVNACLVPLFHCHRCFIITIEGVPPGNVIKERMARGHAAQCGFCSPGFVMSAYALLRTAKNPTIAQINRAISANLCRCTGYRPILEALQSFMNQGCCGGKINGKCCKDEESSQKLSDFSDFPNFDPTQELIFPPSLIVYQEKQQIIHFKGRNIELYLPQNIEALLQIINQNPNSKIVSSAMITRLISSQGFRKDTWISIKNVEEFNKIEISDDWITVGSGNSLKILVDLLIENMNEETIRVEIGRFFENYSSPQVFNFASWIGSILMGAKSKSSVSDLLILLMVLKPEFELISGTKILLNDLLYNSNDKVVKNIRINRNIHGNLKLLKLGESAENDSTIFNFSALDDSIFIGLGGIPKPWDGIQFKDIIEKGGTSKDFPSERELLRSPKPLNFSKALNSTQIFGPSKLESVGRPIANVYNERTVSGDANFVNDTGSFKNAVHLGFVISTVPHAKIINIDISEATKIEGVYGYLDIRDVRGDNQPGLSSDDIPDDTKIFADGKVESVGQIIGVIGACDVVLARRAAKLVKIEYENLPSIVDFKEAIKQNLLLGKPLIFGCEEREFEAISSESIFEGEIHLGGQEHYYLETQSSLAIAGEAGEIVVHCSTQATSFTQLMISKFLDIPANKIIVKTKRLGGAFGGKVSNSAWIACIAALASKYFKSPVYANLSRSEDIQITGKRHEAFAKYRVGIDKNGRIEWCHYKVWLNGGWSIDHTEMVLFVMGIKIDDVYNMGKVRFDGFPVKTNTCSNTAFRGYGTPQAKLINDGIIRRIAWELGKSLEEVQEINMMNEGGKTFLGNVLHSFKLRECWENCKELADFENRQEYIEVFNKEHRNLKRGIALSGVKFGLPHPGSTAHGIASILINLDGSIQLTIGGTEMGQGLNTKMLQIASEKLNRPIETITIIDTSTDKITNAPETGGSQNTDTNGLAVIACCDRILKSGLEKILEKNNGDWMKSVKEAFNSFVPLQCTEYGIVNREQFGVSENDNPYFTTGACCVEVEVDILTGFNRLIRVDIVMDVGESINPAIDIGQIEGAFMQAYGYVTCEKLTFDKSTGKLEQAQAGKYKIPRSTMIPKDFRVKLLGTNKANNAQVYSSKGIGEPPFIMSAGACHSALMKCIDAYRSENSSKSIDFLESISPLTSEQIRKFCR